MQPERPNLGSIGWYAVRTKAKHEKSVAAHLQGKDIVQFLPLYQSWHRSGGRIQSVQLPLFKGIGKDILVDLACIGKEVVEPEAAALGKEPSALQERRNLTSWRSTIHGFGRSL